MTTLLRLAAQKFIQVIDDIFWLIVIIAIFFFVINFIVKIIVIGILIINFFKLIKVVFITIIVKIIFVS